jgi:hypothetical protein
MSKSTVVFFFVMMSYSAGISIYKLLTEFSVYCEISVLLLYAPIN